VLLGVGLPEVTQILRMSPEVTEQFFKIFQYKDKEVFSHISLVELSKQPTAVVEEISKLRFNKHEKHRV
jgi:hypothetical protein